MRNFNADSVVDVVFDGLGAAFNGAHNGASAGGTVRFNNGAIQPEQRGPILAEVKKRAIAKSGLLTNDEFRELIRERRE